MKNILIAISLVFLFSNCAFSAPNYDPNYKTVVYDVADDFALRRKLIDDYHKKYPTIQIAPNHYIDTAPMGAYQREVIDEYYRRKTNNNPVK